MTTTATIEFTEAEIAHRKACAYLKGYIVAASVKHGMKWSGDKDKTPEFKRGFEEGNAFLSNDSLTFAHILYNRLRHNKPHRTTGNRHYDSGLTDFDQAHINNASYTRELIARLNGCFGIDVDSLLTREVA